MSEQTKAEFDDRMLQRVCAEFLEMPGLQVTCAQAQRLFGLNEPTCRALLEFLVEAKFLRCTSRGMYARTSDGVGELSPVRMGASHPTSA